MANFIIASTDSTYSYTSTIPVGYVFTPQSNNSFGNTQGFLRKKQIGKSRVKATVVLMVSVSDYEQTLIPMLSYATNVNVTFDRVIPASGVTTKEFTFETLALKQIFPDDTYEIQIELIEVLD